MQSQQQQHAFVQAKMFFFLFFKFFYNKEAGDKCLTLELQLQGYTNLQSASIFITKPAQPYPTATHCCPFCYPNSLVLTDCYCIQFFKVSISLLP